MVFKIISSSYNSLSNCDHVMSTRRKFGSNHTSELNHQLENKLNSHGKERFSWFSPHFLSEYIFLCPALKVLIYEYSKILKWVDDEAIAKYFHRLITKFEINFEMKKKNRMQWICTQYLHIDVYVCLRLRANKKARPRQNSMHPNKWPRIIKHDAFERRKKHTHCNSTAQPPVKRFEFTA